jgi:hypothetical protein
LEKWSNFSALLTNCSNKTLKKLSLAEQLEGKPGSMSQMVRDGLDDYLKKRASES